MNLYGVLNVAAHAVLLAYLLSAYSRRRTGLLVEQVFVIVAIFALSFLAGARLWNVIATWLLQHVAAAYDPYVAGWRRVLNIRAGGLSFHGGFAAAFASCWATVAAMRRRPMDVANQFAVMAPLGLMLSRAGQLANHTAPSPGESALFAVPVPWQIVEIVPLALLQVFTIAVERRRGPTFLAFATGYSLVRLIAESFRPAFRVGVLTVPQLLSLAILAAAAWIVTRSGAQRRKAAAVSR